MHDHFDAPLRFIKEDSLNRGNLVKHLCDALVRCEKAPSKDITAKSSNFVMGLSGPWGSGKSSIINFVYEKLSRQSKTIVLRFNPWLMSDHKALAAIFLDQLLTALDPLSTTDVRHVYQLTKTIRKYGKALGLANELASSIFIPEPWRLLVLLFNSFLDGLLSKHETIENIRQSLEDRIKTLDIAIVVLIDELDRLEPGEVKEMTRLIKAVGDIRGISYLVAYDPVQTAKMLSLNYGERENAEDYGRKYLEKIIQLNVPLRPLLDYEVRILLEEVLQKYNFPGKETPQHKEELFAIILPMLDTPRAIKRLLESFHIISRLVDQQIYPLDVLGYCTILTLRPDLAEAVKLGSDWISSDFKPYTTKYYQLVNGDITDKFEAFIGVKESEIAEEWRNLLLWLFPTFHKDKDAGDTLGRIRFHRELMRLLYLGNPPHDFSNEKIKSLYGASEEKIIAFVRELLSDDINKVTNFTTRLMDNFGDINPDNDQKFWGALAKALERNSDWATGLEANHPALCQQLENTLVILANRSDKSKKRAHDIITQLVKMEDIQIALSVIRYELFQFGLGKKLSKDEPRHGMTVHDEEKTKEYMQRCVSYVKEAVQSGRWLRRNPSSESLYFLLKADEFDDETRQKLTKQLSTKEAIKTFACSLIPPGYGTEPSTLEQFVDVDSLRQQLEGLNFEFPEDAFGEWAQHSLHNLHALVQKINPANP